MKRPFTKEEKKRLSKSIKNGYKNGRVAWASGRTFSQEHKDKLSLAKLGKIGELANKWIQDRTLLKRQDERNDSAYKEWRRQVWIRDNYRCRMQNLDCEGRIEAHHILGWRLYPELRYITNNGITLCHFHHPKKRKDESQLSPYFQKLVNKIT